MVEFKARESKAGIGGMSPKMSLKIDNEIVALIQENARITIIEMAKQLHVDKRTILRHLEKLRNQGNIQRISPAKGGYWKIAKKV